MALFVSSVVRTTKQKVMPRRKPEEGLDIGLDGTMGEDGDGGDDLYEASPSFLT